MVDANTVKGLDTYQRRHFAVSLRDAIVEFKIPVSNHKRRDIFAQIDLF